MKPTEEKLVFDLSDQEDRDVLECVRRGLEVCGWEGSNLSEKEEALKTKLGEEEDQGVLELTAEEANLATEAISVRLNFAMVRDSMWDAEFAGMRRQDEIAAFAEGAVSTI
ncbi:MAG TPA: hypothetical protein VFH99_01535 [Candidatus Saccharimonadales bacterium]|nr:hypothetical protein [Candidatus Saccharimonadales bacterium]